MTLTKLLLVSGLIFGVMALAESPLDLNQKPKIMMDEPTKPDTTLLKEPIKEVDTKDLKKSKASKKNAHKKKEEVKPSENQ